MHRLKNLIAVILLAFGLTLTASSAIRPQESITAFLAGPKMKRMAPFGLAQFTLSTDSHDIQIQFEVEINDIGLADFPGWTADGLETLRYMALRAGSLQGATLRVSALRLRDTDKRALEMCPKDKQPRKAKVLGTTHRPLQ